MRTHRLAQARNEEEREVRPPYNVNTPLLAPNMRHQEVHNVGLQKEVLREIRDRRENPLSGSGQERAFSQHAMQCCEMLLRNALDHLGVIAEARHSQNRASALSLPYARQIHY